jgi:hypothetical protein
VATTYQNMKSIFSIILFILIASPLFAQNETFDLATYITPIGWKKTSSTTNVVGYTITNNKKGTYCQIGIYVSTASKGSLQADFESEWQELVVKTYKPSTNPELMPAVVENEWGVQGGSASFQFSGAQAVAMLVTASRYDRCLSIVIVTNTDEYKAEIKKFLDSVELKKIESTSQSSTYTHENTSILGTWTMTSTNNSSYRMSNGVMSYIVRQYTLNDNSTYTFNTKTFDPLMEKILLGKENGTYQINGNNLTIIPQKSVLEAWSKKNGTDKWGNFLTTQNIPLEKVTYQFTKHYFSGIQEWSLVLQANTATKREGPFSNNTSFSNAYYYSPISISHPVIEVPNN